MTVQTFTKLRRQATALDSKASVRSKLDWSVAISIGLMVAMVIAVAFGDLGPATAYAAVPM